MRILVVHNRYRSDVPSGEDRVVDQESAALVEAGHDVDRFERRSDEIAGWSLARKALLPARVVWSQQARRSLVDVLRGPQRPDVVHVHNTFPLLSPSVLYACRAASVPVVATVHNYALVCASGVLFRDGDVCHDCVGRLPLPGIRHGCYRGSVLATLPMAASVAAHRRAWRRFVSAYLFLSAAQRDLMAADGFPPERLFVKHNFVPVAVRARHEDVVVYIGRVTTTKGVPVLMQAWDRYRDSAAAPRLRLVIAGAGPLEEDVAAWAAGRPDVEFRGMLSREECAALTSRARASLVPSLWEETFGLVVAEAMAAGVPPIASARGSFPELIRDGVDGVLLPPGDVAAWAATIADVESRPERYEAMGEAARRTHASRFTREEIVAQLLEIYAFARANPPDRTGRRRADP